MGLSAGSLLLFLALRTGRLPGHDLTRDISAAYDAGEHARAYKMAYPLALAGNPKAQYMLGLMYRTGHGAPEDHARAFKWLLKAAANGSRGAQMRVGLMYEKGLGVERDYAEAYRWCSLAEDGQAVPPQDSALGRLQALMTPDQLALAQKPRPGTAPTAPR